MGRKRPYVLIILDGWGIGKKTKNNAVYLANTPFLDNLEAVYPMAELNCSGLSVGLPPNTMGNSEVGHSNLGSGRVVFQDLLRINNSINDQSFYKNEVLNKAFDSVLEVGSSLHLIGLLSDGGVHSHISHLYSLLKLAKNKFIDKIFIHVFLDGRDTNPKSGIKYLEQLQKNISILDSDARISTICGRYYSMDRDNRWNRTEIAHKLCTHGVGKVILDPIKAVKKAYSVGITDEFMTPFVVVETSISSKKLINDKDIVVFFNFRADRARQLSSFFLKKNHSPNILKFLTMTNYGDNLDSSVIFPSTKIKNVLGEVISNKGLKQLRISETEKYAHVTYFFNGGVEAPFLNEDRILIPSPRDIETYDQKPEMSAYLLAEKVIACIKENNYNFMVVNFANMDMVGHTGILDAAIKACEVVDDCLSKIVRVLIKENGVALVTADHGNCEKMLDEKGTPFTAHTENKVPFILVGNKLNKNLLPFGSLCDVAPTILDLMGINKPVSMTGQSLLIS